MALNINGTTGISGVDGSVSAPAVTGTDSNTGITFPSADTIKFSTGGVERMAITNSGVSGISGGKLLQTVTVSDSVRETTGSVSMSSVNTYYDTPFAITITPSATSSKILLMGHIFGEFSNDDLYFMWRLTRAISGGSTTNIQAPAAGSRAVGISVPPSGFYNSNSDSTPTAMVWSGLLDNPSTTSAITYTFQVNATQNSNSTFYYNRCVNDSNAIDYERGLSWITAQEIAA